MLFASAPYMSADKVEEQFQGSLSGNIEVHFFSGSGPVFTGMRRFTEWLHKLLLPVLTII